MTWFQSTLDYLKEMRKMGMGIWQSRLFFGAMLLLASSIALSIIIISCNIHLQDVVELIKLVK